MLKRLFVNLFKTFVFSSLVGVIALRLSYAIDEGFVRQRLDTNFKDLPQFFIIVTATVLLVSLPALLLAISKVYNSYRLRLLCYFGLPFLLFCYLTYLLIRSGSYWVYLPGWVVTAGPTAIFLLFHTYFYFRLVKKSPPSNIALPSLKHLG
nr:hypothetical protein [uncultured Mucilaginibacter sp.]